MTSWTSGHLPPVARRPHAVFVTASALAVWAPIILIVVFLPFDDGPAIDSLIEALPWLFAGSFIAAATAGAVWFLQRRRLATRATAACHQLCGYCGHDLQGVPQPLQCPECGRRFDQTELESYWQRMTGTIIWWKEPTTRWPRGEAAVSVGLYFVAASWFAWGCLTDTEGMFVFKLCYLAWIVGVLTAMCASNRRRFLNAVARRQDVPGGARPPHWSIEFWSEA